MTYDVEVNNVNVDTFSFGDITGFFKSEVCVCLSVSSNIVKIPCMNDTSANCYNDVSFHDSETTAAWLIIIVYLFVIALTPPLSTPLAPDNCGQIHMWRVRGFPLGSPPEGR